MALWCALVICLILAVFLLSGSPLQDSSHVPDTNQAFPARASKVDVHQPATTEEVHRVERATLSLDSKPKASDVRGTGSIKGVLLGTSDEPVSGATVSLAGSQLSSTTRTEADGTFRFSQLEQGEYRVQVDRNSVPERFRPREEPNWSDRVSGLFCKSVSIPGDRAEVLVEIRLSPVCTVWGLVLNPAGQGIEGAIVRVQGIGRGIERLWAEARTDENGRYEIDRVYPGRYRTSLFLVEATDSYKTLAKPVPQDFEALQGGYQRLDDMRLGSGNKAVRGVVLNQDRKAFPGLEVICYLSREVTQGDKPHDWGSCLAKTLTAEDGRFELKGLPAERVSIQVAPEGFLPGRRVGENKLLEWVRPITLDLAMADDHVELPPQIAWESRPFFYRGTVRPSDESLVMSDVVVRVTLRDGASTRSVQGPPLPPFRETTLSIDKTGCFTWACETPHPPVTLVLSAPGSMEKLVVVDPAPGETREETIHFP